MRLHYPDYIRLVKQAYKEKRAGNELSPLLSKSTPANLRKECLNVFQERYTNSDEQTIRAFFGTGRQPLQLIRDFETDRFRPLDNYLKEHTENTDAANLELLAWLIDFRHRRWAYDKDFQLSDEELYFLEHNCKKEKEDKEMAVALPEQPAEEDSGPAQEKVEAPALSGAAAGTVKKKSKRLLIILLLLVIGAGGSYAIWRQWNSANMVCVYWSGDHYEQVSCNEDPKGRMIITMNAEKVKRFKRITRLDTVTAWSIGKLYYVKDSNTIKLYTEGGKYPGDPKRSLRVLSRYIYETYLSSKDSLAKDSLRSEK